MKLSPTRFLPELMQQFSLASIDPHSIPVTRIHYDRLFRCLDDPETKRILFDSRQALLFDAIGESPEAAMRSKIRLPFRQFYCEFTEPMLLNAQEPEHIDYARAFLVVSGVKKAGVQVTQVTMFLRVCRPHI